MPQVANPHLALRLHRVAQAWLLLALGLGHAADWRDTVATLVAGAPAGAEVAVAVDDLTGQQPPLRRGAEGALSLASLTKLAVSAAALTEFGPAWQFRTRVVGLGPIADGSVPGLGVIAGGDPGFDEHLHDDADQAFAAWAVELLKQGVRRIAGDIVIDVSLFSGPIRPTTYPQDARNQQSWFSAPASAFACADNCIEVRVVPTKAGQAAEVQVRPRSPRITVRNQTRTVATKVPSDLVVNRDADANAITVSGTYSRTTAWFPLAIHSEPDQLAADHLKAVLTANGVTVSGSARLAAVAADAGPLLIDVRHDLLPALTVLNQHSQNFYGEQVLRMLGVQRSGTGSLAAGCEALAAILVPLAGEGAALLDGSGLSYDNRASTAWVVGLLAAMQRTPHAAAYKATLKDHPAGKVQMKVKTGTLAIARNLAGYLDTPSGGRYAFAIILNKGTAPGMAWAPALLDKLTAALVQGLP